MTARPADTSEPGEYRPIPGVIPPKLSREEFLAILRSWREGDDVDLEEQRRTGAALMQALAGRLARSAKFFEDEG